MLYKNTEDKQYNYKVRKLVEEISNVKAACDEGLCNFKSTTVDTHPIGMDCIDIFQHRQIENTFFGVYHQMNEDKQSFSLYLGISDNGLSDWTSVVKLQ